MRGERGVDWSSKSDAAQTRAGSELHFTNESSWQSSSETRRGRQTWKNFPKFPKHGYFELEYFRQKSRNLNVNRSQKSLYFLLTFFKSESFHKLRDAPKIKRGRSKNKGGGGPSRSKNFGALFVNRQFWNFW